MSVTWVSVEDSEDCLYYWNLETDVATRDPPQGVDAILWRAVPQADSGQTYFWNVLTYETTYDLPCAVRADPLEPWVFRTIHQGLGLLSKDTMNAETIGDMTTSSRESCAPWHEWVRAGTLAQILGETSYRFYGQIGKVLFMDTNGEAVVKLPDVMGSNIIMVPQDSLRSLPTGTLVEVLPDGMLGDTGGSISQTGIVESSSLENPDDTQIRLSDGVIYTVPSQRIRVKPRLGELDLNVPPYLPSWTNCEKCYQFDAGDGQNHKYSIHFPPSFKERLVVSGEPWPLLVFMHGAGGGTFLKGTKKSFRSIGTHFAMHQFVIVSPACMWKWNQSVHPWIVDLVRHLRACSWIDPTRIYLSGVSMGGMGTWEISAMAPELFAAVVPIAAHHKIEQNRYLVQRLRKMPILAISSSSDTTCPIAPQRELWDLFLSSGAEKMQICVVDGIDHCSVSDRALCDCNFVYEWLLKQRTCSIGCA